MPDGSPISSRVKAETILSQLGITDCPADLVQLIGIGIGFKSRSGRRRWRVEHREPTPEPVQELPQKLSVVAQPKPKAMPPLHKIAPPRIVTHPVSPVPRRELAPSRGHRLSRRDRERREGPERVTLSRQTAGFPLKETVRITMRGPR
jgi:hypothetical protein